MISYRSFETLERSNQSWNTLRYSALLKLGSITFLLATVISSTSFAQGTGPVKLACEGTGSETHSNNSKYDKSHPMTMTLTVDGSQKSLTAENTYPPSDVSFSDSVIYWKWVKFAKDNDLNNTPTHVSIGQNQCELSRVSGNLSCVFKEFFEREATEALEGEQWTVTRSINAVCQPLRQQF